LREFSPKSFGTLHPEIKKYKQQTVKCCSQIYTWDFCW
jgi:hypothetical protein